MSKGPHPATWWDLEWRRREAQRGRQWEREESRQWKLHRTWCSEDSPSCRNCLVEVCAATRAGLKAAGLR